MMFVVKDKSVCWQPVKMTPFVLSYRILLLLILPIIVCAQFDTPIPYAGQPLAPTKVNISIYYEGLCPDSRKFITETLPTAFSSFADSLNFHFVPFGKASIREDGSEYQCQHGKEECLRNIIHGCALDVLPPGVQQFEFVYCALLNKSLQGQKSCVQASSLNWEDIQNCVNGERGLQLTLLAQSDTRSSTDGPKFVPTIVFNNVFSKTDQDEAFRDPVPVICRYLTYHPACASQSEVIV